MFGFKKQQRAEDDMQRGQEIEDRYSKDLASWQIANGLDRQDMTRDQNARFRLHNRYVDAGLDMPHLMYGRRLVETGRCSDQQRSVLDEERGSGF